MPGLSAFLPWKQQRPDQAGRYYLSIRHYLDPMASLD